MFVRIHIGRYHLTSTYAAASLQLVRAYPENSTVSCRSHAKADTYFCYVYDGSFLSSPNDSQDQTLLYLYIDYTKFRDFVNRANICHFEYNEKSVEVVYICYKF